jgi:hypothetical protein
MIRASLLAAIVAVMALAIAAPAPGASLCSMNSEPNECPPLERILKGAKITGTLKAKTTASFFIGATTITCEKSSFELKTTADSGATIPGSMTAFTFEAGKCLTTGLTECGVRQVVNLPYTTAFAPTVGGNGTLTLSSGGNGSPGIWLKCGAWIDCILTKANAVLGVTGGSPALASAGNIAMEIGPGSNCPASATWTAEYELSPKLWIVAKP